MSAPLEGSSPLAHESGCVALRSQPIGPKLSVARKILPDQDGSRLMDKNRLGTGGASALFLAWLMVFSATTTNGEDSPVLHGTWVATPGGSRTFRGRWIGQAPPGQPEALHGSWTLTNDAGNTALSGTWSARRRRQGWQGTWSAQARNQRTVSGTWKADGDTAAVRSLQQLIERTLTTEISGSSQSGRLQGQWWLKGSK